VSGDDLTELAARVLEGDTSAWHALWQRVEPRIWSVSGRWQLTGPLCKSADDRREIVLRVMAKLREGGFRRLRAFLQSTGGKSEAAFVAWLTTVATRVAVDHLRSHPEHVGRSERARWVSLVPIDDVPPIMTERDLVGHATALRVLERARAELSAEQLMALSLWLDGESNEVIATRLGAPSPEVAHRVVRSALKRLRDHFRDATPEAARSLEEPS
jgi:DNA-directed RNA polymerase specialized sigma24 family protein